MSWGKLAGSIYIQRFVTSEIAALTQYYATKLDRIALRIYSVKMDTYLLVFHNQESALRLCCVILLHLHAFYSYPSQFNLAQIDRSVAMLPPADPCAVPDDQIDQLIGRNETDCMNPIDASLLKLHIDRYAVIFDTVCIL